MRNITSNIISTAFFSEFFEMAVPDQFREIVGGATIAAGGIGVPGAFAFGADVPILIGIWTTGAAMIADQSNRSIEKQEIKAIVVSVASGTATFVAGTKVAAKLFHLLPGPGTLAAVGINSGLNAFFTYKFLRATAKIFDKYDDEEMIMQALGSGLQLFTVWTFPTDVIDMVACCSEAGTSMADKFK